MSRNLSNFGYAVRYSTQDPEHERLATRYFRTQKDIKDILGRHQLECSHQANPQQARDGPAQGGRLLHRACAQVSHCTHQDARDLRSVGK